MTKMLDVSTLGTTTNLLTFNDFKGSPLFRMQSWFASRRQLQEFDVPLLQSPGVDDFDSYIGKEYLVIRGKMFPANDFEYHSGREKLRKIASLYVAQGDSNSDHGYVPFKWSENVLKQVFVKVEYVDMPEQGGSINQRFTLVCKIKYPVVYAQQQQAGILRMSSTSLPTGGVLIPTLVPFMVGSGIGAGSSLPFKLPVVLGATSASSGSVSFNNLGDHETYPQFVIIGPVSKPKIVNNTTGEYLEFDLNMPSSSDSIIINYDQDSLSMTLNGLNCYGNLTAGSTPFKVKPGPVTFSMSGQSVGAGAQASVSFLPAWPLS